jgi:hypothetical protein
VQCQRDLYFGSYDQSSIFCKGPLKQVDNSVRLSPSHKPHSAPPIRFFQSYSKNTLCAPEPRTSLALFPRQKICRWRETKCLSLRCQCSTNVFELPLIIGQATRMFWKPAAYISGYSSGKGLPQAWPTLFLNHSCWRLNIKVWYCFKLDDVAFRLYRINILYKKIYDAGIHLFPEVQQPVNCRYILRSWTNILILGC